MSIKKVQMFTVECDGKGCQSVSGEGHEIVAWTEPGHARDEAIDSFDWIHVDGKDYCPSCTKWNEDETELVPKNE